MTRPSGRTPRTVRRSSRSSSRPAPSPASKVDEGTKPLPGCPGELINIGLDKLADRLPKYYARGARFAKWRAVIDIGAGIPTHTSIHANAHALGRYAALCQAAQIVPIVEPEVLMDGDHDIDRCYGVTEWVLKQTFQELYYNRVALEGMVLKLNMVVADKKSKKQASVEEVAEMSVDQNLALVGLPQLARAFSRCGVPLRRFSRLQPSPAAQTPKNAPTSSAARWLDNGTDCQGVSFLRAGRMPLPTVLFPGRSTR